MPCWTCSAAECSELNLEYFPQQESFSEGGWGAAIADHYQRSVFIRGISFVIVKLSTGKDRPSERQHKGGGGEGRGRQQ